MEATDRLLVHLVSCHCKGVAVCALWVSHAARPSVQVFSSWPPSTRSAQAQHRLPHRHPDVPLDHLPVIKLYYGLLVLCACFATSHIFDSARVLKLPATGSPRLPPAADGDAGLPVWDVYV